jgi:hypothetical protein
MERWPAAGWVCPIHLDQLNIYKANAYAEIYMQPWKSRQGKKNLTLVGVYNLNQVYEWKTENLYIRDICPYPLGTSAHKVCQNKKYNYL